jgi:hypothetical protein
MGCDVQLLYALASIIAALVWAIGADSIEQV